MSTPANLVTARELFTRAGCDMCALGVASSGHVIVDGKGGPCLMTEDGWAEYRRICGRWGHILHDVPTVPPLQAAGAVQAMRQAFATLVGDVAGELAAVDGLISSAQTTLSVDDYGDSLAAARRRLGELQALVGQVAKYCAQGGAEGA